MLKENLLLGKLDRMKLTDDNALCAILSSLGIHISIDSLSQQVGRQFNKDGLMFSPGQAQKICVVRTLIKDAPIVILDEPSSAMDAINEDEIIDTAFKFSQGKIMLFISHRLSNLKKVDKIVLLSNGCVSEAGSHEELMINRGQYFSLYNKQSNKYL
jgi:ATP-binding cassette subfamily B protein